MSDGLRKLIEPLASLRLTVWLLGLSLWLIFAGTWAQIDLGIWAVLEKYFRSFWVFIPIQIFFPREWALPGAIPFPGGSTLGLLLLANLIAAHTVRFKWGWDRAGINLIHFSIIMLLVGEFVTGMFAVESRMSIDEGQTVHYAEDVRSVELALVDPSDPEKDRVIVVPQGHLERGGTISHPELPFDLRVDEWFGNSMLIDLASAPERAIRGTRGVAMTHEIAAIRQPPASGVVEGDADMPVAKLTVVGENGEDEGSYLAALYFALVPESGHQQIAYGGKSYDLWLRFVRHYKPYTMHLVDFKHDRYLGTETAKNFSSLVRLEDPSRGEDREVLIWMNNPLRYEGETFYQASFKPGDGGTVLQVVENPGWLLPYVACTIGGIGLTWHFILSLLRFQRRRASRASSGSAGASPASRAPGDLATTPGGVDG